MNEADTCRKHVLPKLQSVDSKSAKIFVRKDADFTDRRQWKGQIEWLAKYLRKFTEVFGPVVKGL